MRKTARRLKSSRCSGAVVLTVPVGAYGREVILGAAYLMMDRAYVFLSGSWARALKVTLRPKQPASARDLESLAQGFEEELGSQAVRWGVAKNNQPIREFIAEQAVLLASGRGPAAADQAPEPAPEQLTETQRQEIEKLIAEVEAEIKELNEKKLADPKSLQASWEETREPGSREAAG